MKKNLIIVIGSDGSGKSTLVNELNKRLNYKTSHFSAPKGYQEAKDEYYSFAENAKDNYILDRYYEGEFIFAPLYRGYDGSDYFEGLESKLKEKFNVLLVYVKPEFKIVKQRILERGEDFVKEEHYEYCYNKVDEFYNNSTLPKIKVDTGVLSPKISATLVRVVFEYIFF